MSLLSVFATTNSSPERPRANLSRIAIGVGLIVLLLSVVRVVSGADDLTSSGSISASLRFAAPLVLAGLGGLWAERAGVINIGLEGMMVIGTWFGAWAGYQWGPGVGVLVALAAGACFGLLHALATVTFGVDQVMSGLAINLLAAGMARYLSKLFFVGIPGGTATKSPPVDPFPAVTVPGLSPVLQQLESQHWLLLSDIAGILGGLVTEISVLTILAIALVFFTHWMLWSNRFGLRVRSSGENPWAADSLGINVIRVRYIALAISGALAGMGGAFLVTVSSSVYNEGQVAGRGFIGLATVVFGNWRPIPLGGGALLFGFTDAVSTRQPSTVHAFLLVVTVALVVIAIMQLRRRRRLGFVIAVLSAGGFLYWYLTTTKLPDEIVAFAPHVITLVVLAAASQRLRPPASEGLPFRRGDGH